MVRKDSCYVPRFCGEEGCRKILIWYSRTEIIKTVFSPIAPPERKKFKLVGDYFLKRYGVEGFWAGHIFAVLFGKFAGDHLSYIEVLT